MAQHPTTTPPLPPLGYIGVEVHFTRIAGDGANPKTWPFPLLREEATGTALSEIVSAGPYSPAFVDSIVAAAERLVARGCVGVITDCGFMALLQRELAERVSVPVAASALCQLPSMLGWVPGGKGVGVVTFDGEKMGVEHFKGVGVAERDLGRVWVMGLAEDGLLRRIVDEGRTEYDVEGVQREIVDRVRGFVAERPGIAAVLLECTQMAPFAKAVQREVGLPVYDIYTLGCWFYQGLVRRRPEGWGPPDGSGPYT